MRDLANLFKSFILFTLALYRQRLLIIEMTKRDISVRYVGSFLGFFWTFINPIFTIFIFWFVFSVGFKTASTGNVPFVIFFTAGMAIWNTFTEASNLSTGVIVNNSHLVKKVVFHLSILPVVKLASSFVTHSIFLLMTVLLILLHGMPFSVCWFQALYYFGAMSVFTLGLSWIFSSVNVFARDTGQIVGIILQFGFWGTPIFWDIGIMPEKIQFFIKLNPMYYIVQGYRDSFLYFVPFWKHPWMTLYFWIIAIFTFVAGAVIFRRLRPHFADVL